MRRKRYCRLEVVPIHARQPVFWRSITGILIVGFYDGRQKAELITASSGKLIWAKRYQLLIAWDVGIVVIAADQPSSPILQ
jgi:hypothetical protein